MAGRTNAFIRLLIFAGILIAAPLTSSADIDTVDAVVVVYNSSMPASKEVADHYAAKRAVPAGQVLAFDLPQVETISREDFSSKLQQPLWRELRARKLLTYGEGNQEQHSALKSSVTDAKIRYVVLCYGVPLKITPEPALKENAEHLPQELRRNEAAVESELSALPLLDQNYLLAGPMINPLALTTNRLSLSPTNGLLMVTRVDGPTPDIAKSLVDKAILAEKEGLWGNAYIDTRSITNAGFKAADDMFNAAAELCRVYGFEVVKDTASRTFPPATPMSDIAFYFGWYDQSVSGPFTNGMAQFRPGAVAYHLHSFSSRALRVTDVWWTGPLLAAGATATIGFTEEPYLQTTPQINAFVYRFVQLGFSLGEAMYAAIPSLSWQTAIIGDPLYRPFQKSQKERYAELEASNDKDIEWSMLMWINFRLSQNAPLDEILQFYRDNPQTRQSALLQEKLGDVFKSKGKLIDALTPYENALKLPMPALRKLRLSLKAGSLFSTMGRAEEAYKLYRDVLKDFPDFAGKKDVYERLSRVAARLKKNEEAVEFERLAREQPNS